MVGACSGGRLLAIGTIVLGFALYAMPAAAQSGVKGRVVDAQNKPVEGAKITIVQADNPARKFEVTTNKKGEFVQVGVPAGDYRISAQKGDMAQGFAVHVSLDIKEVNFTLKPGSSGAISKEEAAKEAARIEGIKAKFAEGAALSTEGKYDEAIAKFNEVLVDVPKCSECWTNIGSVYSQKKEYDKSEEAYKKALEMNPESADAYNGLATIYNAQKRFEDAEKASAEAAKRMGGGEGATGGGNPEAFYNQGVIAWNGNNFAKALEHFTNAVKASPNHAESHFMLGKVYLNLGKLPEAAGEFQTYLKIAPTGPNAKEAQAMVDGLKPYIK